MTILNLIATLVRSVAMRFSTVIATLLVFTIFFYIKQISNFKFQKSNSNAVAKHKNRLHLELHHSLLVQNS